MRIRKTRFNGLRTAAWVRAARALTVSSLLVACNTPKLNKELVARQEGQSEFASAAPNGQSPAGDRSAAMSSAESAGSSGGGANAAAPASDGASKDSSSSGSPRSVEETDIYRLDGNRLYFLNAYRGLMIFDVSNPDSPTFLGRSPITGWPVEMVVRDGFAHVVVSDWYGQAEDGAPFYGSVVRSIDVSNPASPSVTGEAKLVGWVRDLRVVGNVLYAVSEDYGWSYGYDSASGAVSSSYRGPTVNVTSISFSGGRPSKVDELSYPGYQGIFNVTANAILLAHDKPSTSNPNGWGYSSGMATIEYLDIADAGGDIIARGKLDVTGSVPWSGSDGGRFNLDFDGRYARAVLCNGEYCGSTQGGARVVIADFNDTSAPVLAGSEAIVSTGWGIAARFLGSRLYVSPGYGYSDDDTPLYVYDLSNPANPEKTGETALQGQIWSLLPGPTDRLFALGSNYHAAQGAPIRLSLLNVENAASPSVVGESQFGSGWAWTPAAGTFKAFTMSSDKGLVVLPFSGWSYSSRAYNNGVQLIEFTDSTLATKGAAKTKGWVERGILVGERIITISDQALSVVEYSNRETPTVVKEIELARNVVDLKPAGEDLLVTIGDFWDYDQNRSRLQLIDRADATERHTLNSEKLEAELEGSNPRVFYNGRYAYAVTTYSRPTECKNTGSSTGSSAGSPAPEGIASHTPTQCFEQGQVVQVIDIQDGLKKLGRLEVPSGQSNFGQFGWFGGCFPGDWYYGDDTVQVEQDALLLRRWEPSFDDNGSRQDWKHRLYVLDLKNPNEPKMASTLVTNDQTGWWGNLRVVGNQVYSTHYEWYQKEGYNLNGNSGDRWYVKYFLDQIDLSNRTAPSIKAKINVPGVLVGGIGSDLLFVDYRWADYYSPYTGLAVATVKGGKAYLRSYQTLDGYVGNFLMQGNKAYTTLEKYEAQNNGGGRYTRKLLQVDLSNPMALQVTATEGRNGYGWLLAIEGDRALMTSGWAGRVLDVYKLSDAAPTFDQSLRIRSWWANATGRVGNDLYLATGYYGIEKLTLQP